MKIIKSILGVFIILALIAIGYIYNDIVNASYDWLGAGKTLSIICLITLSLILLRFALRTGSNMNFLHAILSIGTVLASVLLINNVSLFFDFWKYGAFLFLTQATLALWDKLNLKNNSVVQRLTFLLGPLLIAFCMILGWFPSFMMMLTGIALLLTSVICIGALFRNRIS